MQFQLKLDSPVQGNAAVNADGIIKIRVDATVTTEELSNLIQACDARSRRCVGLITADNVVMPPSVACRSHLLSSAKCFRALFAAEHESPDVRHASCRRVGFDVCFVDAEDLTVE
jgi:hypothetical protein